MHPLARQQVQCTSVHLNWTCTNGPGTATQEHSPGACEGERSGDRSAHTDLDGVPELQGVLHLGDLEEGLGIGDAERAHAILVAPFLEVALERAAAPVALPAADLACEFLPTCHVHVHQYRDVQPSADIASDLCNALSWWGWGSHP